MPIKSFFCGVIKMKLKYYLALVLMLLATPAKAELEINVAGAMRDPMPQSRGGRFGPFGVV